MLQGIARCEKPYDESRADSFFMEFGTNFFMQTDSDRSLCVD